MGILVFLFIFLVWGNSTVGPDLGSAWGQEPVTGPGAGPTVEFLLRILGHRFWRWTLAILLSIPCSLLFLIYIAARNIKLTFKHSRSIIKSRFQKKLEESGTRFNRKTFSLSFSLKNHLSFGLKFTNLRKSSKIGRLGKIEMKSQANFKPIQL